MPAFKPRTARGQRNTECDMKFSKGKTENRIVIKLRDAESVRSRKSVGKI